MIHLEETAKGEGSWECFFTHSQGGHRKIKSLFCYKIFVSGCDAFWYQPVNEANTKDGRVEKRKEAGFLMTLNH